MPKKNDEVEVVLKSIRFIREFDGYKVGDVLQVSESNLMYFVEWDAVEVL